MRAAQEMKSLLLLATLLVSCSTPNAKVELPNKKSTNLPPSGQVFEATPILQLLNPTTTPETTTATLDNADAETQFWFMRKRENPFEGNKRNYPAINMVIQPNATEHDNEIDLEIGNQTTFVFRFNLASLKQLSSNSILGKAPKRISFGIDAQTITAVNPDARTATIRMQDFSDAYAVTTQFFKVWMQINKPDIDEETILQTAEALAAVACRPSGEWFETTYTNYVKKVKDPVSRSEFAYLFRLYANGGAMPTKDTTPVPQPLSVENN